MRTRKLAAVIYSLCLASALIGSTAKSATKENVLTAIHGHYQPAALSDLETAKQDEIICLALNLYHEDRGGSENEIRAVGFSTRNRVKSASKSFCEVIWERGQYVWTKRVTAQTMPRENASWLRMVDYARPIVMDDTLDDPVHGANSFYSRRIRPPRWAVKSSVRLVFGSQVFVKQPFS